MQQALDTARVSGNYGVHAGKMDRADVTDPVDQLFGLIKFIVGQPIHAARENRRTVRYVA